jgi:phage terminase large subunit-like protein
MPALAATFRLYYLNQRVRAEGAWIDPREWDACGTLSSPADGVAGRRAWLGLDLAAVSDMTALAIVIPTEDEGLAVRVEYFMPAAQLEARAQEARAPLAQWVEEGRITLTGGNTSDYAFVARRLQELIAEYEVEQVGVDPWNARQLVLQLQQDGLPAVEVQQNMKNLSHAVKEFERLVLSRRLAHDRNPVLAWNLANVIVEGDAHGNVRLNKRRASGKIDGLAATITALSCALVGQGGSIYEGRGPLLVDL